MTWRDISGYEGRYSVSDSGEVFSFLTDRVLRPGMCTTGYLTVNLRKNGASKSHGVHVLVARAFLENPEQKPTVNHKDGKRLHFETVRAAAKYVGVTHSAITLACLRNGRSGGIHWSYIAT